MRTTDRDSPGDLVEAAPIFRQTPKLGYSLRMENPTQHGADDQSQSGSDAWLRAIFASDHQSITILDPSYTIRGFSRLAQKIAQTLYGRPMRVGQSMLEFVIPGMLDQFCESFQAALNGAPQVSEMPISGPEGEEWWAIYFDPITEADGAALGVTLSSRNITAQKRAEAGLREAQALLRCENVALEHLVAERTADLNGANDLLRAELDERKRAEQARLLMERKLQEAQRLESIGVLAGGIAHDFNNLLAGILGYAELALMDTPPDSETHECISAVISSARHAADLTGQMLAYAGKGRLLAQPLEINALIHGMADLIHAAASQRAAVLYQLAERLPLIDADAVQLRQVIMNLVTNAAEATEATEGAICITTAVETLDAARLQMLMLGDDLPAGDYVCLSVEDAGRGMDEGTLARIFDPFFTTRFTGRGLGLAAVQGIVRSHRGALHVSSTPGHGTVFRVWLPASTAPVMSSEL